MTNPRVLHPALMGRGDAALVEGVIAALRECTIEILKKRKSKGEQLLKTTAVGAQLPTTRAAVAIVTNMPLKVITRATMGCHH